MKAQQAPWDAIAGSIAAAEGIGFFVERLEPVGGGCINEAYRLEGAGRRYFVKLNRAEHAAMFEAEADGLEEILATGAVKAPHPVTHGVAGRYAFLVLEYLELGRGDSASLAALGTALARMHRRTAERFGWRRDNAIGSTPQRNPWSADWIGFWREARLGFQLELAARRGHRGALQRLGERLLERLPALFQGYTPVPSLLHGDLWAGNHGATREGTPVVFDPAVYYGDREADLAMTELFGGFGPAFYRAYQEAYPLDPGYRVRKDFYNLYHLLNHANLFGAGYAAQAQAMMERLLAHLG
ncbi:MAG: fructosamine kinase family protein [Burkholderiales bacterium]|nr:MAG: fructosamine kinase family protein [Burkholderiales bacterium]